MATLNSEGMAKDIGVESFCSEATGKQLIFFVSIVLLHRCKSLGSKGNWVANRRRVAPRPFWNALTWTVTGLWMSKYFSGVSLQTNDLLCQMLPDRNCFRWTFFLSSAAHVGVQWRRRMRVWRVTGKLTNLRNFCSWVAVSGASILWTLLTFPGLGWAPVTSQTYPKTLKRSVWQHTYPCWRQVQVHRWLMNLWRHFSCSLSSFPWISTSSVMPITHSQWARIWSIIHWKMSCAQARPQGGRQIWTYPMVCWRSWTVMTHSWGLCTSRMRFHLAWWSWYFQPGHGWSLPQKGFCSDHI